jgi:hypothetical protein
MQSQTCWRELLLSGYLKVSGPTQTLGGRPTYSIALQNRNPAFGSTGLYQVVTVYADDFTPADTSATLNGGAPQKFERWVTSTLGVITYYADIKECRLWAFRPEDGVFNNKPATCPPF